MKSFLLSYRRRTPRKGHSLVEVALSLGVFSFGLMAAISVMPVGLKASRSSRNDLDTVQIAGTLIEQARQGTLSAGREYLGVEGDICSASQACYTADTLFTPVSGNSHLQQLSLRLTPVGAPDRVSTYAVVIAPSS